MAVLIGGITPRATVTDNATLFLDVSRGVYALNIGSRAFVYGQGEFDDGISAFELDANGSLTNFQNIADTPTLELDGAINFASAVVGGHTYLFVNGYVDSGISAFRVAADGTLTSTDNVTDDFAGLQLYLPQGRMATAVVGGATFLVASGSGDNGVSVFRIENGGTLTNTYNVTDGGPLELAGPEDVATATVNGRTFVFVASYVDSGLSVFELDGQGRLSNTFNVTDGGALNLDSAIGVATAEVGSTTYVIASGNGDNGLSVFSVSETGQLANVFNVSDSVTRALDTPLGVTTFTLDGETFVAVSAVDEDALGIFHLGAGGVLTDVTTIFDSATTALDFTLENAFALVDGTPFLIANGRKDKGLSVFDLGSGNDILTGTANADLILALAGNDLLDGGTGSDRLIGGSGDDTYAVDSAGDTVLEQPGGGTDTVQASLSITLAANVENLTLTGTTTLNGTGNGLANQITGNGGANRLLGREGNDILKGGGKADTLLGGAGKDLLSGQGGADDFVFTSLKDSGLTKATRDQVLDFKGKDQIDLHALDAIKGAGNQDFSLDQDGSFSAGEIRFHNTKAGTVVEFNVDRDAKAEMSLLLKGLRGELNDGDFVL